jgi:hypothetical protein
MRGSLWRVSNEQLRPATADESRGVEIVNRFLSDMKTDLQSPHGPKRYLDVTREGPPRLPQEEPENPAVAIEDNSDEDDETRTPMSTVSRLSRYEEAPSETHSDMPENSQLETRESTQHGTAHELEPPERSDPLRSEDTSESDPTPHSPRQQTIRRRRSDEFARDVIARARDRERRVYPWPAPDHRSDQGSMVNQSPGRERSPRRDAVSNQHFVETADKVGTSDAADTFFASEAEAEWQPVKEY